MRQTLSEQTQVVLFFVQLVYLLYVSLVLQLYLLLL
jgi:hypothetical protein